MEILVAKSYQGLPIVEEPYTKNGKQYCKIQTKTGTQKEVRVYTQKEYDKLYPEPTPKWGPQRNILGFGEEGFIFIFNNNPKFEEFYEKGPYRFHVDFGWYLPSNETVPVLPEGIYPKILPWEVVGNPDGNLKEKNELRKSFERFLRK